MPGAPPIRIIATLITQNTIDTAVFIVEAPPIFVGLVFSEFLPAEAAKAVIVQQSAIAIVPSIIQSLMLNFLSLFTLIFLTAFFII